MKDVYVILSIPEGEERITKDPDVHGVYVNKNQAIQAAEDLAQNHTDDFNNYTSAHFSWNNNENGYVIEDDAQWLETISVRKIDFHK